MLLLCHEMLEIIHVALIEKCGVCRAFTYSAYKSYGFISDKNCDIMIMIRKQNMLHKSLEKSNLWHKIQRTQFSRAKLSACSGMCVLKKPLLKFATNQRVVWYMELLKYIGLTSKELYLPFSIYISIKYRSSVSYLIPHTF